MIYKKTFFNTLITFFSTYWAYCAYFAEPYSAFAFYGWTTLATLTNMGNAGKYIEFNKSVSRIYILEQGYAMRVEMRNGKIYDLPISAVTIA